MKRYNIVDILGSIDEKIENNEKVTERMQNLLDAYFKEFIAQIDDAWEKSSLSKIANYINGLAMQKYRPTNETFLPVLKIKELSQGFIDTNSEQATTTIDSKYIIDNGDIIFSWSGTLLVKIWCGGKAGLNQHLFKVVSEIYPKWFYYLWTLYHLESFQNIAKGKAVTMGHIKREDLDKAIVFIPPQNLFEEYDKIFTPILNDIIQITLQNNKLNELKQLYLKKFFG